MSNETLLAISWHSAVVSLKGVKLVCSKAVLVKNSTVGTPAPSDVEVAVVFTSPLTSVPLKLCSCHSCSFLLRVCRGRKAAQPAPNTIYPDTSADADIAISSVATMLKIKEIAIFVCACYLQ